MSCAGWDGRPKRWGSRYSPGSPQPRSCMTPHGRVAGVATGNQGVGRDGQPTANFQPGVELRGQLHALCRRRARSPGPPADRPLRAGTRARSADLWHRHQGIVGCRSGTPRGGAGRAQRRLAAGPADLRRLVPVSRGQPSGERRFRRRPGLPQSLPVAVRGIPAPTRRIRRSARFLEGGKRVAYGARAITAGGLQSLPQLVFPGGALIGCEAGFLNAARIKGTHGALVVRHAGRRRRRTMPSPPAAAATNSTAYPQALATQLAAGRTCTRAAISSRGWTRACSPASLMFGIDQLLLRGRAPWTLQRTTPDHAKLMPAAQCAPIDYPKPDGRLSFDRLSSVFLSNTNHEENQPVHLTLKDPAVPVAVNLARYAGPEARYCPAGVYEFVHRTTAAANGCRSMRRTACTARPATSRTRPRTSSGSYPKAAADRAIRTCSGTPPPRPDGAARSGLVRCNGPRAQRRRGSMCRPEVTSPMEPHCGAIRGDWIL